jgi:hypothetical protein
MMTSAALSLRPLDSSGLFGKLRKPRISEETEIEGSLSWTGKEISTRLVRLAKSQRKRRHLLNLNRASGIWMTFRMRTQRTCLLEALDFSLLLRFSEKRRTGKRTFLV